MLSLKGSHQTLTRMDDPASIWQTLRTHLEQEKERILDAMIHYPTPIAGCDQQFNYLLEEQTRIRQALEQWNRASQAGLSAEAAIRQIDEFIRSYRNLDAETAQTLRSYLQEARARDQR